MRNLILTALIAATAIPGVAAAQSNADIQQDRRDIRRDQRELRQDWRRGQYGDIRDDRRDLRDSRQDYRDDVTDRNRRWAREDWRSWRDRNRTVFTGGYWRAPFRYYSFRPGVRIEPVYYGPRYVIADPWRYHLYAAGPYQRWVRHYNDMLLVDYRRGVVVDVIRGFYY